jgi:hypothetical protein
MAPAFESPDAGPDDSSTVHQAYQNLNERLSRRGLLQDDDYLGGGATNEDGYGRPG